MYWVFFGRTPGIFSSLGGLLWVMSDDTEGLHLTYSPFIVLLAHLPHLW